MNIIADKKDIRSRVCRCGATDKGWSTVDPYHIGYVSEDVLKKCNKCSTVFTDPSKFYLFNGTNKNDTTK